MNWPLHVHIAAQLTQQARVAHATAATFASQAAIRRTTGIAVPTAVVDDGVKNAYAKRDGTIAVHTGIEAWRIPSVYAHEVGHHVMGHTSTRPLHPVYAEAEADYAAGYLLAASGMASASTIGTSMTAMAMGAGGDHGSAQERATRVWLGFVHGASTQNPWALYR